MPAPRGPKRVPAPNLDPKPPLPRAKTPSAREDQLAALAYDLAEKQLLDGTASAQVMSHFLRVGSTREKIELEKVKQETILVGAKVKDLENNEDLKILYQDAMDAVRGYGGQEPKQDDNQDVY